MKYVFFIFTAGMICTTVSATGQGTPGTTAALLVATLIITLSAIGNAAKL